MPDQGTYLMDAVVNEVVGHVRHMRGAVRIESTDELLKADEVDYDEETGNAEARGHVHFEQFARGEKLECDRARIQLPVGNRHVLRECHADRRPPRSRLAPAS